jgi:hypothetical protein
MRSATALLPVLLATVPLASAEEATRTLTLALSGDPARSFAVENLVGTMRVVPGSGDTVTAVAVVHGESEALAASVRFEQVAGERGTPTLRLRYPVDRHTTYRSPTARAKGNESFLGLLFGGGSTVRYDGVRVRVSSSSGVLLYADVEVQLPRREVDGRFVNRVGPMTGRDVTGKLWFDTGSGGVTLEQVGGDVVADTGSGDVSAVHVEGRLRCDTGSGDCSIESFKGERLSCDTGSGDVRLRGVEARYLEVDTGSGEVRLEDGAADEVEVDTGSGDVALQADGARLRRIKADTGSGSVHLRLGEDAAFEARADVGSGDIVSRYKDAQPIVRHREVVGYRRGDGHTRIDVDTGSGDLVLDPGD